MRKSLKSQVLAAAVMCLIATIALTSATYAWFTAIANPEVNTIDLYVKAADTIMLSAYDTADVPNKDLAADWKATITQTDIKATTPTGNWGKQANAFPTNMLNVSSLFNSTSNGFYTSVHNALGGITGYSATLQPNNFSKFSLWAKSTRNGYLYLDEDSVVSAIESLGGDVTTAVPGSKIKDTVRIGIVPVNTGTENWARAVIWEPNSKDHLDATYGGPGGTNKLTTSAVFDVETDDTDDQDTFDFVAEDTNVLANGDYSAVKTDTIAGKIALFDMTMDVPQNFNIYIWVEGADADTQNAVAKTFFRTYLKFGQEFDKTIA